MNHKNQKYLQIFKDHRNLELCMYIYGITTHISTHIHSSIQLHYISSAVSLYFPYDFCLYPGMTAVVSYSLRYIPFLLAVTVSIICYSVHR